MLSLILFGLIFTNVFASDCTSGSMGIEIEMILEDESLRVLGKTEGRLLLNEEKKVLEIKNNQYPLHLLTMSETILDSSVSLNARVQMTPETLVEIIKENLNKKVLQDKAVAYNLNEISSYGTYFPRNPFIDLSSNYFSSAYDTEDDTQDVFYPARPHGTYDEAYLAVKFNFSKSIQCQ
jgi:hypothetical protein